MSVCEPSHSLHGLTLIYLQAFGLIQQEFGISPSQTPGEAAQSSSPDRLASLSYLTRLQDQLQNETPVIVGKTTDLIFITCGGTFMYYNSDISLPNLAR